MVKSKQAVPESKSIKLWFNNETIQPQVYRIECTSDFQTWSTCLVDMAYPGWTTNVLVKTNNQTFYRVAFITP